MEGTEEPKITFRVPAGKNREAPVFPFGNGLPGRQELKGETRGNLLTLASGLGAPDEPKILAPKGKSPKGGLKISLEPSGPEIRDWEAGPAANVDHIDEDIRRVIHPRLPRFRALDVAEAAEKEGVPPELLAAFLRNDSRYGTAGMGSRNNNPGNVRQLDGLKKAVPGYGDIRTGLAEAAKELKERIDAYRSVTKNENWTAEELARGTSWNGIRFAGPYMTDANGPRNVRLAYRQLLAARKA